VDVIEASAINMLIRKIVQQVLERRDTEF